MGSADASVLALAAMPILKAAVGTASGCRKSGKRRGITRIPKEPNAGRIFTRSDDAGFRAIPALNVTLSVGVERVNGTQEAVE